MTEWIYDPQAGRCRKTVGGQAVSEDRIAEIRARHAQSDNNFIEYESTWDIHADRATLLAEVDRQRAEIERLRAKIKWLIEDDERLHYVLYRIANPPPFADCPVEMAQNATRGEHLRREAFDGIQRALEGKP